MLDVTFRADEAGGEKTFELRSIRLWSKVPNKKSRDNVFIATMSMD